MTRNAPYTDYRTLPRAARFTGGERSDVVENRDPGKPCVDEAETVCNGRARTRIAGLW